MCRYTLSISIPRITESWGSCRLGTVLVVGTAEEEKGPLGDIAGSRVAVGIGLEEVGLGERCCFGKSGEDDEEQEHDRSGRQDEANRGQYAS